MRTTVITLVMTLIASVAGAVVVNFPDGNLEAAVRSAIGIPSAPINDTDLAGTGFTYLSARSVGITDLSGLEYCSDLTSLHLDDNQISDISAVAGLANLTNLELGANQIINISAVAGLSNLDWLGLYSNQISDISALAGLSNLTNLEFYSNQIVDISAVTGLSNLTHLQLGNNQIIDISTVAGLTGLDWLALYWNEIIDISAVAGLINLESLLLANNQIIDISAVAGLTNLNILNLSINQISGISALVTNAGIGSGDTVYLQCNPLSLQALLTDIPTLEARGAEVISEGLCPASLPIVYVDFAAGSPTGTGEELDPVDSLSAALIVVEDAGVIRINEGSSTETATINQVVAIEAVSGTVLIGVPGGRSSDNGRQWGFLSRY